MLEVKLFCDQLELHTIWETKRLHATMAMMEKKLAVLGILRIHIDKPARGRNVAFLVTDHLCSEGIQQLEAISDALDALIHAMQRVYNLVQVPFVPFDWLSTGQKEYKAKCY